MPPTGIHSVADGPNSLTTQKNTTINCGLLHTNAAYTPRFKRRIPGPVFCQLRLVVRRSDSLLPPSRIRNTTSPPACFITIVHLKDRRGTAHWVSNEGDCYRWSTKSSGFAFKIYLSCFFPQIHAQMSALFHLIAKCNHLRFKRDECPSSLHVRIMSAVTCPRCSAFIFPDFTFVNVCHFITDTIHLHAEWMSTCFSDCKIYPPVQDFQWQLLCQHPAPAAVSSPFHW